MGYGNTPHIVKGGQDETRAIFYSKYENAIIRPISIPGGFGVIPSGAIIAEITSECTNYGYFVPYVPEAPTAGLTTIRGGAYLVVDGAASTSAVVTMEDSYMFTVGDHLLAVDSDGSPVDLGALVSVDQTTYSHIATLTVTNQVTTGITVANGGLVAVQSTTSTPYVKAVGVLAGAVDTGRGENAKGAQGALVLGGATLYKNMLENYDSEVLTDLGCAESGDFLVFK